jgi:hypothetical protein
MIRRVLLTLLLLACGVSPVWAAITFDAASITTEGTTSTTGNATIAADANIAIVCVHIRESTGAVQPATAATVGGAAATFLAGVTQAGNVIRTELWYKLAPATGTVAITSTGHASTDIMVADVMSFKGVAQTSTFNTAKTASGDSTNVDVTSIASAVGEVVAYCGTIRGEANTASADGTAPTSTERYEDPTAASPGFTAFGYTEDGAATSIDMRVDITLTGQWAAVAASMRAAAATATRRNGSVVFP